MIILTSKIFSDIFGRMNISKIYLNVSNPLFLENENYGDRWYYDL